MYNRLSKYFDSLYFSSQWRFRKGFSLQHCLLVMLENLEKAKGRRNDIAALLTSFFRFWLHSSQSYNWKALLLWSFPRCSADNFFSSKVEWNLPKLIPALVLDQILNMDFSCLFLYSILDLLLLTRTFKFSFFISELQVTSTQLFIWSHNSQMKANPCKFYNL